MATRDFGEKKIPFPVKKMFKNSEALVETRRQILEAFLRYVCMGVIHFTNTHSRVFISLILRQYVALYFAANPQLLQRPSRAAMVAAMPFFDQIADE